MITDILPRPKTVTIQGREFVVSELDFNAFADLQAWIKDHVPHPLAAIRPHLEGLKADERKMLLEMAYADAGEYPPRIGTMKANEVLSSPDGIAFQLSLILKITEAEARELSSKMSRVELKDLMRIANNLTPDDEIEREGDSTDPKEVSPPITSG